MWPSAIKQLTDLPENSIVAIFNARRSSLNMASIYLRFDSMILVGCPIKIEFFEMNFSSGAARMVGAGEEAAGLVVGSF